MFRNWEQHGWEEWECQTEVWACRPTRVPSTGLGNGTSLKASARVWRGSSLDNTYVDTASLSGHSWSMDYYGLAMRKAGYLDEGPHTTYWDEMRTAQVRPCWPVKDQMKASRDDFVFALSPTEIFCCVAHTCDGLFTFLTARCGTIPSPHKYSTHLLGTNTQTELHKATYRLYFTCFECFAIQLCLCFITPGLARVVRNVQHTYHIPHVNSELLWIPQYIWFQGLTGL